MMVSLQRCADFFRLGRAVRYRREDLDEWRNRFRATSTTEADATLPRSLTTTRA
jgi:hypothetical protein